MSFPVEKSKQTLALSGITLPNLLRIASPLPKNAPITVSSKFGIGLGFIGAAQKLIILAIAAASPMTALSLINVADKPV